MFKKEEKKEKTNDNHHNIFINYLGEYSIEHEQILGIDISPHYIRVGNIHKIGNKIKIKELASVCIEELFTKEDILNNMNVYVENLIQLLKKENIKTENAAVALPVSESVIMTGQIPYMEDSDLAEASKYGNIWQNMLGFEIQMSEYEVFYQVTHKDKENNVMDVVFAATPKRNVQVYTEILKQAGLNPIVSCLKCLALDSAFAMTHHDVCHKTPVAYVEFGPDENYFFVRRGKHFFMTPLYLPEDSAYQIARNQEDEEIVNNFIYNYYEQLKQALNHYNSEYDVNIKHVYASSTLPLYVDNPSSPPVITVFISKLSELLHEDGVTISDCSYCNNLEVSHQNEHKVNAEGNLAAWAVTIGLASERVDVFDHYDVEHKLDNINFLDIEPYKKVERTKLVSMMSIIGIAVIGLVVVSLITFSNQIKKLEINDRLAAITSVDEVHKENTQILEQAKKTKSKLEQLEDIYHNIPSNQEDVLKLYYHVVNSIPSSVWLKEINFIAPNKIEISGNSLDDQNILEFISQLKMSDNIQQISLKEMQTVPTKSRYTTRSRLIKKFTLYGTMQPNKEDKDGV